MTQQITAQQILAMPLDELRERVSLAERIALAARLTPTELYAGASPVVQPSAQAGAQATQGQSSGTGRGRGRPKKDDTPAATQTTTPANTQQSTTQAADELELSLETDDASGGAADGAELTLDDGNDEFDMLSDNSGGSTVLTPEQMREKIAAIATDIRDKKDTNRLTAVKGLLQKYGIQRVTEIGDDKLAAFYNEMSAV